MNTLMLAIVSAWGLPWLLWLGMKAYKRAVLLMGDD